jgi:hypothetical protein
MKKPTPYPLLPWYGGLLMLGFPFILLSAKFRIPNMLISIPFLIGSFFFLTVAQVQPSGDHVRYRRFRRWKIIKYSEIQSCGTSWIFGYLRTSRFLPPWGTLYFTRDQVGLSWDSEAIAEITRKANLD